MTAVMPALELLPVIEPRAEPVRILFVAGLGRSGSTIVANVLGQHERTVSIGELVHLWSRGLKDNELCGCGEPFGQCQFWAAVGDLAFGGWYRLDIDQMLELQHRVDRNRYVPLMIAPRIAPSYRRSLDRYAAVLSRIYLAIREVSGCAVIIDSTKHVSYAFLLGRLPDVEVKVAHLVRDSQGVAHSWAKTVRRPEVADGHDEMPRYSPARTSAKWMVYNAALHGLGAVGTQRMLIRYEDMMAAPREQFRKVLEFAGLDAGSMDHLGEDWVELSSTHTVAGNPSRFDSGRVPLRLDAAWKHEMGPADRRLVAGLTWPLSRLYGYGRRADSQTS